jgi:hypothetical protein
VGIIPHQQIGGLKRLRQVVRYALKIGTFTHAKSAA